MLHGWGQFPLWRGLKVLYSILPSLYALPFYDFDLRASHARTLLPAALASVPFGFVLARVRVRGLRGFGWVCSLLSHVVHVGGSRQLLDWFVRSSLQNFSIFLDS